MNDIDALIEQRLLQIDRIAVNSEDSVIDFEGFNIHVNKDVFNPKNAKSTRLMLRAMRLIPPTRDSRILEIGTGTGILSIYLWTIGCRHILASDIEDKALINARMNFDRFGISIDTKKSDLFSEIDDKFDYIIFNAPASHPKRTGHRDGAFSLWDYTGNTKKRFIDNALNRINSGGFIVFMYSKYSDFDPFIDIDLSPYEKSFLFLTSDNISETGIVLLIKK